MRIFVIGDIHGGLKGLKQLLNRINLKKDDELIFLGDYVDGWSESAQVIDYLIDLSKEQACIFIKGNHDVWCEHWLRTQKVNDVWLEHGGKGTVESYINFSDAERKIHLKFFEQMKLYHLDKQNRLFLHAGFTSMHGVEDEESERMFYNDRTLLEMAMTMDSRIEKDSKFYPERLKLYKEIFIGHTPTINYNSELPIKAMNVWDVDTGAAFYGKLSAVDINSKEIIQSDILMELYPEEKGRNERSKNEILGH
ncbi:MAG: metallophosphoesterase family protein [Aquaticitalea sp.]